ncbi:hypothetical protein PM082_018620 [Marasmius tenuissimus]|nr:hypothetical protein PM082_018620 [Marasmius tenuissimus]
MHNHFEARGLEYKTRHEYGSPGVFVGLSLAIKDLHKLHSIPGVKIVHPVRMFIGPEPAKASFSITKRAAYVAYDSKNAPFTDTLHAITVSRASTSFMPKVSLGKGIQIGIIDTGIDYNHPALGNGYGKGHKITGGFDFIGDLGDITPPFKPDNDPMDCWQGHGTRVAGIIGASPGIAPFNMTGVAYDAELSAYKVVGCGSGVSEDVTVVGLVQADKDGNDSVVASRVAEKGRIVTIAAGNEGADDACECGYVVDVGGDTPHDAIPYFDLFPLTNISGKALPIYAFANDTMEFGCANLTDAVPNLENHVVVTRIGGCAVLTKQFLEPKKVRITFPKGGRLVNYEQRTGGLVSAFSTYGPSFDLRFKPSIGAHGGQILSTYPLAKGGYVVMPGTSMATPYLAGCAALYLQVRGKNADVARQARNFFESTSVMLPEPRGNSMLQSATSQGAGLVDAYAAAYAQTYVWPGELLLNNTEHFRGTQNFTVKNLGSKEKEYDVNHFPAGTVITIRPGSIQAARGPIPLTDSYAKVELSPTSFTLAPNESKVVTAKFAPPQGLDNKTLPVYSGFIQVEAEGDGEEGKFHVSYMGVTGSLYDQQVLDDTDDAEKGLILPAIVLGEKNGKTIIQDKATTFEFKGNEMFPQLIVRLAFGSPQADIEFVDTSVDLDKVVRSKIPVVGSLLNQTCMPATPCLQPRIRVSSCSHSTTSHSTTARSYQMAPTRFLLGPSE